MFSRRSKLGLRAYDLIKFFAHKPERAFVFSRHCTFPLAGVVGGGDASGVFRLFCLVFQIFKVVRRFLVNVVIYPVAEKQVGGASPRGVWK